MDNIPRVLAGRYEVGELIGRGGMAEVHIGYDSRLSRTVAIKLLRTDLAEDPTFHARFRREAQSAAALNHPAIVAVYDTGEEQVTGPNGKTTSLPFIVMEYVEGHTVRELLKDGAAVPIDEAVEIVIGILGALEYAHHEGIVHRDIKPGNIMLTPTGQVKVMDFGIARAIADQSATMTQTNSVVGTAQYLSPEQARGETVDARSDLYSTGCVLFELLTGRPPFSGDSPVSVAYQHVREMPPVPSSIAGDIPESLDRVVLKALAKSRDDRYQDAAQFRADLLAVLHGGRISAPATQVWAPAEATPTAVMGAPGPATTTRPVSRSTTTIPAARPLDDPEGKKSLWWVWLLVVLAVLLGLGIWRAIAQQGDEPTETTTVAVPDVTNYTQQEAIDALEKAELVPVIAEEKEESDSVEADHVIRTNPAADEEVETNSKVTVVLSSGVGDRTVPDVTGMTQEQARAALEKEDLTVGSITTEDDPDTAKDRVIRSEPSQGSSVEKGTSVDLVLATGLVDLPSLVGYSKDDALRVLSELNLSNSISEVYSNDQPEGYVVSQSDQGKVDVGSQVELMISMGTSPTPSPTPTTEPTESASPSPTDNSDQEGDGTTNSSGAGGTGGQG